MYGYPLISLYYDAQDHCSVHSGCNQSQLHCMHYIGVYGFRRVEESLLQNVAVLRL